MTDPVTTNYGWTKPTVGADNNTWGGILNADLDGIDTTVKAVSDSVRSAVPVGSPFPWLVAAVPAGFLMANGQAVSRTTYAALFALFGTTFGSGDGSTTFNMPNLRDTMMIGAGNVYALLATGGAVSNTPTVTVAGHALTVPELPAHNHTATDSGHAHTGSSAAHSHVGSSPPHAHTVGGVVVNDAGPNSFVAGGAVGFGSAGTDGVAVEVDIAATAVSVSVALAAANVSIGNTGSGSAHSHTASSTAVPTLPPYIGVNWIIKT